MSEWDEWPPARPIRVDGGIRARSKRGAIGEQWWSRRFIEVLESYGMSGRLARGRSYARAGQVLDFELSQGKVTARVQGSRPRPYQVRIGVLPLTTAQWRRVLDQLASQALFRAKLLAGEMPREIEEVFAECGTPLFPGSAADLDMHCSCPDWGVPCKHLAAVCYVLAEEFDRDPFGMLAWRGKDRAELLAALRRIQGSPDHAEAPAERDALDVPAPPLAECLDGFWSPGLSPARLRALATAPDAAAPDLLLRMFPPPPSRSGSRTWPTCWLPPTSGWPRPDPSEPGDEPRPSLAAPPEGAQTRSMASGRPHQPSGVSRSSSSIAPSTCHSEVTGRNRPSSVRSSPRRHRPGATSSSSSSSSSSSGRPSAVRAARAVRGCRPGPRGPRGRSPARTRPGRPPTRRCRDRPRRAR